jgi:hypothetical protein
MNRKYIWQIFISTLILMGIVVPGAASPDLEAVSAVDGAVETGSQWCVAGSFQGWDNTSTSLYDLSLIHI